MFDAGGEDADHGLRRLLGRHLGAGALVTFAPAPEQLIFVLLLVLSVVEAAILWFMPETATPEARRTRISAPARARAAHSPLHIRGRDPVNIASWSLGGFYFSLMPSVVSAATAATLPIIGSPVVATLNVSAAVAVVILRKLPPERTLILGITMLTRGVLITLAGIRLQNVNVMLFGTVVGGTGFGTVFSGTFRSVGAYAQPGQGLRKSLTMKE
jgi:hypothetical protein